MPHEDGIAVPQASEDNTAKGTLELLIHDVAANGPERDLSGEGLEYDRANEAPERYDRSVEAPEVVPAPEYSPKSSDKLPIPMLNNKNLDDKEVQTAPSSDHANPSGVPSPFLSHGILENSSFAAAITADGTRHVIFQDNSGQLRDALFLQSSRTWISNEEWVIKGPAKNNTPLSAVIDPGADGRGDIITLFYIDPENQLAASTFYPNWGVHWPDNDLYAFGLNLHDLPLPTGCRFLSVVRVPGPVSNTTVKAPTGPVNSSQSEYQPSSPTLNAIWVLFESAPGQFSIYQGNSSLPQPWTNKTSDIGLSRFENRPFTAFYNESSKPGETNIAWMINEPGWPILSILSDEQIVMKIPGGDYRCITVNSTYPDGGAKIPGLDQWAAGELFDIVVPRVYLNGISYPLVAWVDGTTFATESICGGPIQFAPVGKNPESSFPYRRLATATQYNTSSFMLYHQINGTTFAEDIWDPLTGVWTTDYVMIRTW